MSPHKHLTIVIKLGTSSIVDAKTYQPLISNLSLIVDTAVKLQQDGHRVVIVSSGAIGVGLKRMNMEKKPKHLRGLQALAAVGQSKLMSLWDSLFSHLNQPVAQILLTRNDIADRSHYLNAENTLMELLKRRVIPIVNENDTISVSVLPSEIKFGDNDTLSAITAAMIQADYLFLMTDVDCLYTSNPRKDPNAAPIEVVADIDALAVDVSSAGSLLGTGGMFTKLIAARLATSVGVTTIITRAFNPGNVLSIVQYVQEMSFSGDESTEKADGHSALKSSRPPLHTRFLPSKSPIRDRRFWLLHGLAPHGTVYIDEGAHRALRNKAGLLPAGVVDVDGTFGQQQCVRLVVVRRLHPHSRRATPQHTPTSSMAFSTPSDTGSPGTPLAGGDLAGYNKLSTDSLDTLSGATSKLAASRDYYEKQDPAPYEVGRALVTYSSVEIARVKGLQSSDIINVLGYADSEYVAPRGNISLLHPKDKDKDSANSEVKSAGSEQKGMGILASFV